MGLFDTIGSVIGTKMTNDANLKAVKMTNDANAALWREQSEYNTPANQMKRLEAAGLNPNLAYGQIAESRASNPPAMEAAHYERPIISVDDAISQYQQVKNMQALNAKTNVEIEVAKAQAIKAASDADYTAWENEQLKKSGTLKSDPTLVKEFQRGSSVLGGYLQRAYRYIQNVKPSPTKPVELQKYVGNDERAHNAVPAPDDFDYVIPGDKAEGVQ